MELIDDFKKRYPRYWSVWLNSAAAVLALLELLEQIGAALPALQGQLPAGTFAALSFAFTIAGLIARALKQSKLVPVKENGQ